MRLRKYCGYCGSLNNLIGEEQVAFECFNCRQIDWISEDDMYTYSQSENISLGEADWRLLDGRIPIITGEPS